MTGRPRPAISESVRVAVLPLDRPDARRILLERIHMHHPVQHDGMERAASGVTGLLRGNRSAKSKLRIRTEAIPPLAKRRHAEISVLVPSRYAERDTRIKFVFSKALRRGVHHAHQFVIVSVLFIQQRRRMLRIEVLERFASVTVIGEVVHLLRDSWQKNTEALGQCNMV